MVSSLNMQKLSEKTRNKSIFYRQKIRASIYKNIWCVLVLVLKEIIDKKEFFFWINLCVFSQNK